MQDGRMSKKMLKSKNSEEHSMIRLFPKKMKSGTALKISIEEILLSKSGSDLQGFWKSYIGITMRRASFQRKVFRF